ncbi:helix-turn-helix transcriptional regulator [Sphingopyxis sp. JAI108]|uniref:helix-turn-helix transcriptional regulator n=1 Tax=Sphingopyxis sp. JAI108 TaxID=2723060 RepID=UPI0015CE558B|nr:helix-turn-helix transcriptional regulator [Sphingopyxis sp. JAI108]NYF33245.1 mRNA interferase RelE/StbE [Sphingopyxis sp. JAI108]
MVTIPREEYDRLREAAVADLRAYDGAKAALAALAAGEEELVPADYAKRLIAGESPLRELRGLSQVRLGAVSGVNRVQIADIEAGRGKGSVETVRKLAEALGVRVGDLV